MSAWHEAPSCTPVRSCYLCITTELALHPASRFDLHGRISMIKISDHCWAKIFFWNNPVLTINKRMSNQALNNNFHHSQNIANLAKSTLCNFSGPPNGDHLFPMPYILALAVVVDPQSRCGKHQVFHRRESSNNWPT